MRALTPRQLEVIARLADGRSTPQVARDMGISLGTARQHVASALRRTRSANRTELVARWARGEFQHA